jgi:hypothetical protein
MKYIDTERQLADIFTKPLYVTHFASLRGILVFAIPMAWFEWELVFCLAYTLSCFSSHSFHLSTASPVILACIWLIMLINVLG